MVRLRWRCRPTGGLEHVLEAGRGRPDAASSAISSTEDRAQTASVPTPTSIALLQQFAKVVLPLAERLLSGCERWRGRDRRAEARDDPTLVDQGGRGRRRR